MIKTIDITIFAEDYEDLHDQVAEMIRHTGCIPSSCVLAYYDLYCKGSVIQVNTCFGPIPVKSSPLPWQTKGMI